MTAPDHGGGRKAEEVSGESKARNLTLRIVSAAVLAPVVLAITYAGGWWFFILFALAAGGILLEWTYLVADKADLRILVPGGAGVFAALLLTGLNQPGLACVAVAAGTCVAAVAVVRPASASADTGFWEVGGVIYAGAAFLGPALLRRDPQLGLTALLFLFATVWATDIFAFFCGRAIGGPRLWPSVSPNKTWSGGIGGLAGGLAAGVAVAYASGIDKLAVAGIMGLVLSVVAQAGDLFESAVKRHFGAKDASHLIPGHGGLMDRLDGFLIAALAALLIGILRQGLGSPGRGLLLW